MKEGIDAHVNSLRNSSYFLSFFHSDILTRELDAVINGMQMNVKSKDTARTTFLCSAAAFEAICPDF